MRILIHNKLRITRIAFAIATLALSLDAYADDVAYETRVLSGSDGSLGPGLGPGLSFSGFDKHVINSAGRVAFRGLLAGTEVTSTNDSGIWSVGGSSGLALIAREGSQAPGTSAGVNFGGDAAFLLINSAGQTAFSIDLTGPGVSALNRRGIWSEGGGTGLSLVARMGSQAPGTPAGSTFIILGRPVLNDAGQVAFGGTLLGSGVTPSNNQGIWAQVGELGTALIVRKGSQAPGVPAGVNFGDFLGSLPMLNNAGQISFRGTLTGVGVNPANNLGIWSQGGGSGLSLLAREGSQAPGVFAGMNFGESLSDPAINGSGQVAFTALLTGAGVNVANDSSIWSGRSVAELAMVAREGDPAPGTADGVIFGDFEFYPFPLNNEGQIAFGGTLAGPGVTSTNDSGIWSERDESGLALVAREGSQAPGLPAGVNFGDLGGILPMLNNAGQVAFIGTLAGEGVIESENDMGIWATDLDGVLQPIARTGDLFDVSNDPLSPDMRTISFLFLGDGFNDAGQLAFEALFTGGSRGIFVATIGSRPAAPFRVTLTRAVPPASGYDFAWNSRAGKVYDLVSSIDLATPATQWPVYGTYGNIPATGIMTTLTEVPAAGPQRFFAVVEKDAPMK